MKNKAILLAIISLAVVVSAFMLTDSTTSSGVTSTFVQEGMEYTYDSNLNLDSDLNTKEVTLTLCTNKAVSTVAIPNTVTDGTETYYVTAVGNMAFRLCTSLSVLTFGDHVREIGDYAFYGCTMISNLNLNNVVSIGAESFMHNTALTTITAPDLEAVGDHAFAIALSFNGSEYTGTVPTILNLSLPSVKTIGQAAFGKDGTLAQPRSFGTVTLPAVEVIGDSAFNGSAISMLVLGTSSQSSPVREIGDNAFYFSTVSGQDPSVGYTLYTRNVETIGDSAFTGRAIRGMVTSAVNEYTIGTMAFSHTELDTMALGNVTSIGNYAFDDIEPLQWFTTHPGNTHYQSYPSSNLSPRGQEGALYRMGNDNSPDMLIALPHGIKSVVEGSFTVADGVEEMFSTAAKWCPDIEVDLNDILVVPTAAFTGSDVTTVIAESVTEIGVQAFAYCASLTEVQFPEDHSVRILQEAFLAANLERIETPQGTIVESRGFADQRGQLSEVNVWGGIGEYAVESAFEGVDTLMLTLHVDDVTREFAEELLAGWNNSEWKLKGSDRIPLLKIDNSAIEGALLDISSLTPPPRNEGENSRLEIVDMSKISMGDLQFVEYRDIDGDNTAEHVESAKAGVYEAESHTGPNPILTLGGVTTGDFCSAGDGITWALVREYYVVHYWSFDSVNNGTNPDYENPDMLSYNVSVRVHLDDADMTFLQGDEMRHILWPEFMRYTLEGWYAVPHDGDGPTADTIDPTRLVTSNSVFGSENIPEAWIYRDNEGIGHLNIYAVFVGKEYFIALEARQTTGSPNSSSDGVTDGTGGYVEITLSAPYMGSFGFDTRLTGAGSSSYPYGTEVTIRAIPNEGFVFVGWIYSDATNRDNPAPLSTIKSDRAYVNKGGQDRVATHPHNEVQADARYTAFFARTTEVTFNYNDGTPTRTVEFVTGDYLEEAINDYNSYDYAALAAGQTETGNYVGPGDEFYPGTPEEDDLEFVGWFNTVTGGICYGRALAPENVTEGQTLYELSEIPAGTLTLIARWEAVITLYEDDGINEGDLPPNATRPETSPNSGQYTYRLNVGSYVNGSYSALFTYHNNAILTPTAAGIAFNGWYVLDEDGTSVEDILPVAGANRTTFYPDAYPNLMRLESGTPLNGHISLIALYTADVMFHFNDATEVADEVDTPSPYRVPAPISMETTLGDPAFGAIHAAMLDADTTGDTYKNDAKGKRMKFMGWYLSAPYSNADPDAPISASAPYGNDIPITQNTRLIAGWGITVDFDAMNVEEILDKEKDNADWDPAQYYFTVLEGTVFDETYSEMPTVVQKTAQNEEKAPTSWYDGSTTPYAWFENGVSVYTYSVTLTPEFQSLFQFNMMGGSQGLVLVPYSMSEQFQEILERFFDNIVIGSQYIELEKAGLYYMDDGSTHDPGDRPNAVWYRGDTSGAETVAPNFANNPGAVRAWGLTDTVDSEANAYAYIRWLADISFDTNIPANHRDGSSSPEYPDPIRGVDEGSTVVQLYSQNLLYDKPVYSSVGQKTFKGWYSGNVQYSGVDSKPLDTAPPITGHITFVAHWNIEIKFYYDGRDDVFDTVITNMDGTHELDDGTLVGSGTGTGPNGTLGITDQDEIGKFIIIEADNTSMIREPRLTKSNMTAQHFLWYKSDWETIGDDVSLVIPDFVPLDNPNVFNRNHAVTENATFYVRWYATVSFNFLGDEAPGGFFEANKFIVEGVKLSDLMSDPETNLNLNPYPNDREMNFIGWFRAPAAGADYENLGEQYYRTTFDYLPDDGITPSEDIDDQSLSITTNLTLRCEFAVPVEFDGGYESAEDIPMKYLRWNRPLPASGERFTGIPDRAGVTFMGWVDRFENVRYTVNERNSAAPDPTRLVEEEMTLTAAWLITVSFYDLEAYYQAGALLAPSELVDWLYGPDGEEYTNDDYFEMPEGTELRQLIAADPSQQGKTFVSWFVEQDTADGLFADGDVRYGILDKINSDVVLTAGYGFLITFDTNGAVPSVIEEMTVIEGQNFALPESPAKGSRTFKGWNDGDAYYNALEVVTPEQNTLYTAKWRVMVSIYDGISLTPMKMEWDEDDGPSFEYTLKRDSDYTEAERPMEYDGNILSATVTFTPPEGEPVSMTVEKFIDRYNTLTSGWESYYSVFDGWLDPLTGNRIAADANLGDYFGPEEDWGSVALFAVWKERVRFYDSGSTPMSVSYVDTGDYLGTIAPSDAKWANLFSPTELLNIDTYRVRDSIDLVAATIITVVFDAAGGSPSEQVFSKVVSRTMLGAIGAEEPIKDGGYFAGWYSGNKRYTYTDRLMEDTTLTAKWTSEPVERYVIFAVASDKAHISPSGMIRVMDGDSVSFDFHVDRGYTAEVLIDGVPTGSASPYTFSNVNRDRSIEIQVNLDTGSNPGPGDENNPAPGGSGSGDENNPIKDDGWGWLAAAAAALLLLFMLLWLLRSGLFVTLVKDGEGVPEATVMYSIEDKEGEKTYGNVVTNKNGKCRIKAKKETTVTVTEAAADGPLATDLPKTAFMEHRRENMRVTQK